MVTILDVAREAKVSPSTVSRVLNKSARIKPENAEKVHKAIERLGYEPNVYARSLRNKETHIILVLTPNLTNSYYAHILSGIAMASRDLSYNTFICNTGDDSYQLKELMDKLSKRQADGAILLSVGKGEKWLADFSDGFPIVQTSEYDPNIAIPHVCVDNYKASYEAVSYLISLGHRRIATISSVNRFISTEDRLRGYQDALKDGGITPTDNLIVYASADYSYYSGCNEAKKLLKQPDKPTAIFCIGDILAIGAINTARSFGLDVPGDLSVIGFDDVEQTVMFSPQLTTVAQPCHAIGKKAVELLHRSLSRSGNVPLETILPYELIIRESTAPPPE